MVEARIIRMMVASGERLIAMAGSARYCRATPKAWRLPLASASMVRKPVMVGGGSSVSGKRPDRGSQPSHMAKASWKTRPRKKRGMEMAPSETVRDRKSGQRLRYTADKTPSGTPMTSASRREQKASSSVAGKKAFRSSATGRPVRMDVPKSPRARAST